MICFTSIYFFAYRPFQTKLHLIVGDVLRTDLPFFDICVANLPYQVTKKNLFGIIRLKVLHHHIKKKQLWRIIGLNFLHCTYLYIHVYIFCSTIHLPVTGLFRKKLLRTATYKFLMWPCQKSMGIIIYGFFEIEGGILFCPCQSVSL